jgi:hypothetical protein
MARRKPADGPEHQTWRMVIDLLKRENYWVMLSNGVRMSAQARGWDDVVAMNGRSTKLRPHARSSGPTGMRKAITKAAGPRKRN